ncbi:MAG: arginase [Clostridia bacterium]|nr:arginase [Clostridia bacterium]
MKVLDLIKACTDLGVNKDGAELAPNIICENVNIDKINKIYEVKKEECMKELDVNNKKKNIDSINRFNQELYHTVCKSIENGKVPITIGGDHSIAIATCLASKKYFGNIGLVWFDAHADFNTFHTTITGNIHGLPFASVVGQNGNELTQFFEGEYFNPQKCVLIGARSIDYPGEYENLKKAGINVFTTKDIKERGVKEIFESAIQIVTNGTNGFHLSIDTDVIDPKEAPGVSVPEVEGITKNEFIEMIKLFMNYKEEIKTIDVVEYNPKYDIDNITLNVVNKAINMIEDSF